MVSEPIGRFVRPVLSTVLILVLVEDGLGGKGLLFNPALVAHVLILVLVEDGLGELEDKYVFLSENVGLNPCFSGGWSRSI